MLRETDPGTAVGERVEAWLGARPPVVDRYRGVVDDVEQGGVFDLATLAVVRRALRELAELD